MTWIKKIKTFISIEYFYECKIIIIIKCQLNDKFKLVNKNFFLVELKNGSKFNKITSKVLVSIKEILLSINISQTNLLTHTQTHTYTWTNISLWCWADVFIHSEWCCSWKKIILKNYIYWLLKFPPYRNCFVIFTMAPVVLNIETDILNRQDFISSLINFCFQILFFTKGQKKTYFPFCFK